VRGLGVGAVAEEGVRNPLFRGRLGFCCCFVAGVLTNESLSSGILHGGVRA
jgi:hypothetical protein